MIDKNSVAASLQTLANQVRDSDQTGHDRLQMLSQAVLNPTPADAWTSSNIYELIDSASIVELYKNNQQKNNTDRLIAFMEIIRNTLIFTPIMVTWYAISQATDKYNQFIYAAIQANKPALYQQPFLYLWQQHFNGSLPDFLTLSSVAITDVVLLLIILIFTFFVYFLSNRNEARKEQDVVQLRANLAHTLAGAVLSMRSRPPLTPEGNLEEVARQIDGMARYISGKFDTMAQQTAASFDKMSRDTVGRFDAMARDLTKQFTSSTQQTQAQLDQIVQEMNKQLQAGGNYLLQLGKMTSGVVVLSSEIQTAANELKQVNSSLLSSINNLVGPATTMAAQQDKLLVAVQQSVGLLQGSTNGITDLVTRQQKMAAELTDVLDTLTLAVEKFDKLAKDQSGIVGQQTTFVQLLQDEHSKLTNLATLLADSTIKVKDALTELGSGAVSLRRITVDMNDIMRLQASQTAQGLATPPNSSNTMGGPQPNYADFAQTMENSGNALMSSAIAIQRASQQLREVLEDLNTKNSHNGHI